LTKPQTKDIICACKEKNFTGTHFLEENGMNGRERISLLFDCYSRVLSPRQRDALDLYYNEDLSLAEIAEQSGITRQAVRDLIKHGEERLYELEECLHVYERGQAVKSAAEKIISITDSAEVRLVAESLLGE